jgi:uncharacterized membrane protein YeaQ/YmgE (transglycosylase-associated protein family)
MEILGWIVFGLIVGAIARFLFPGKSGFQGCLPTIALGIVGAVVGGFIGQRLGIQGWSFVLSVIGAVLVLVIYQGIFGRRSM